METKWSLRDFCLFTIFVFLFSQQYIRAAGQPADFANSPNLRLWFDGSDINGDGTNPANGEAVNFWADKSGFDLHATNAGKTGGVYVSDAVSGVYFGNSNDNWLRTELSSDLDFVEATIFMVADSMSSYSHFSVSEDYYRDNEYLFWESSMSHHFNTAAVAIWPGFTVPDSQLYLQVGFWGQGFYDLTMYLNGTETFDRQGQFGQPNEPDYTAVPRAAFFGQRAQFFDEDFDGTICEIIVFEGKLTQEEHNSVGFYLSEKYGIDTTYSGQAPEPVPTGTAFTYQGFLRNTGGGPVNRPMDFCFTLYDGPDIGMVSQIGSPLCMDDVELESGHFKLSLDFGPGIFNGDPRWLETSVRKSDTGNPYVPQTPLLELTFSPYAIYADTAGSVLGGITGIGTASSIPMFTDPNTLSNSIIHQDSNNIGIGVLYPGEKLSVAGTIESTIGGFKFPDGSIQSTAGGTGSIFPQGGIIMWSGPTGSIPQGWALCDGTNGTPNLMDRFVKSIPNALTNPGAKGGSATHIHEMTTLSIADHSHTISTQIGSSVYRGNAHYLGVTRDHGGVFGDDYEKNRYGVPAESLSTSSTVTQIEGATDASSSLPVYYEIAFIMKK